MLAAILTTIAIGVLLRGAVVLIWSAAQQHPLQALNFSNPSIALIGGARAFQTKRGPAHRYCLRRARSSQTRSSCSRLPNKPHGRIANTISSTRNGTTSESSGSI